MTPGGEPETVGAAGSARWRFVVPAGFVAAGILLFAYRVAQTAYFGGAATVLDVVNLFAIGLALCLSALLVISGVRLHRSSVPPARYRRAGYWSLGGAAFLVALNAPLILLLDTMSLPFRLGWIHYSVLSGAAGGAIVGFYEARAIEHARAAERESARADYVRRQAGRLDYLNNLLRHEVLNNANVISGYASLAREKVDGDARGYMEKIEQQSEDMTSVVDDVRVLLEALGEPAMDEEVDLAALLSAEVSALESRYEDVEVEATIPERLTVPGDELVGRAFGNLLTNAVEHNDADRPRVEVAVEADAETVSVRVADDGPGVPESERDTLFERSGRGNQGLGLYLVRVLVDRYGGTVELAETGPDGSVFAVHLPRTREASAQSPPELRSTAADAGAGGVAARQLD